MGVCFCLHMDRFIRIYPNKDVVNCPYNSKYKKVRLISLTKLVTLKVLND